MPSMIDFSTLDLRAAFDFAVMIEEDAQLRYAQLARLLGDDAGGAGDVFRTMVVTEGKHRNDLIARREAIFRDGPRRIEISVLDEDVERPHVDDDDLPSSPREALEVALAAERRAYAFFRAAIPHVVDPAARELFAQLMEEEAGHEAFIAGKIAALPPADATFGEPRERPRAAPAMAAPETYPDRAALEAALPRFDAATQAVAKRVVVDGLQREDVAEGLGVSRRTVSRKLTRFLALARQHVAVALAAATVSGCAAVPHEAPAGPAQRDAPAAVRALPDRLHPEDAASRHEGPPAAERDRARRDLAARIRAQVAARMPGHDPSVQRRVARAIVAETTRAGVDPLLVLALIHVESSFDPAAVSDAGAVGLMQLVEPTMRRELERSGLSAADPHDPVANVQAGVRYLRRLIDAFGEVDTALMAYNAGPNRIRGHQRRGGIPERFHVYPRRVKRELERLRVTLGAGTSTAVAEASDARTGPLGS